MGAAGLPWSSPGGGNGGSPSTFYADLNLIGVFPVKQFGAIGDGVANDKVAIRAADTAAAAFGLAAGRTGAIVYFHNPHDAFLTDEELAPTPGNQWIGEAEHEGQCTIRATAAVRSVVMMHVLTMTDTTPTALVGLTLDANNRASYALLRNGDWLCRYERLFCINARLDNRHANGHRLPMLFSAVVQTGAGPALTVSQRDLGYSGLGGGATNIVVKSTAGGYVASFDGGATFATFTQTQTGAGAVSNLAVSSLAVATRDSGVQLAWGAGAPVATTTYAFTATVQTEEGQPNTINVETRFTSCWDNTSGADYASLSGAPGRISTTAGSQVLVGTGGTTFLSGSQPGRVARPGDSIEVVGQGIYPVMSVSDNGTILTSTADCPQATIANAQYALHVGYGYYVDDSGDNVRCLHDGIGRIRNSPGCMRLAGDSGGGDTVHNMRLEVTTGIATLIGTFGTPPAGTLLFHVEYKHSGGGSKLLYVMSEATCTAIEPLQNFAPATDIVGAGAAGICQNGSWYSYNSGDGGCNTLMPIGSLSLLQATVIEVTSDAQQFNAPDVFGPNPLNTSYLVLHTTVDRVLSATPIVTAPQFNGQTIILENASNSTGTLTFQDWTLSIGSGLRLSGPEVTLAAGDRLMLLSTAGSPFNPKWLQLGEPSRQYTNPSFRGGGDGRASKKLTTADGAAHPMITWDLTDGPTIGFLACANVAATDGAGALGFWDGVRVAVDANGNLLGPVTIDHARGTAAGNVPPAGWAVTFVRVAGPPIKLVLQVTGAAGVKFWADVEMTSAPR